MSQISNSSVKLLRLPAVMEMTGLGRSTVYHFGAGKEVSAAYPSSGTKDDRLVVRCDREVGAGSVIGRPGFLTPIPPSPLEDCDASSCSDSN